MKRILVFVVLGLIGMGSFGWAQEESANKVVALEWVMGIVKSVDIEKKAIEVSYYDFENDKDAVITVYVTDKTEFLGSPSLKEINPGDDIEVSYTYSDDGRPIAEAVITAKFQKEKE